MEANEGKATARRPFSTLRKESSAEDDITLYNERKNSIVPVTSSPFVEKERLPDAADPEIKLQDNELKVYVEELKWSDLLLEIAMTTAFASLTDGTPILDGSSVASYLTFFALVWWVWASQVAYNVRFRQSDWLHRLFVFLQLLIFCALAAFTNNFDITNGISNNSKQQNQMLEMQLEDFYTQQDIAVGNYRNGRLPTLNARGISITMALSRMILLAEYLLTLYHVPKKDVFSGAIIRRDSFHVHIASIAFSAICYFTAYIVVGKNPNETDQIAKLVLWYLPLLVEVAAHFIAQVVPGRVRYQAEAIYERSSTVFIIILGGGLDRITNGFQYVVGNVSVGFEGASLIACAAIIFILLFTLYFGTSEGDKLGSRRALALFFFQYFYLSALIVTLQGIAAMLNVGNIGKAMSVPFDFVTESSSIMSSKGFGVHLNETDYSGTFVYSLNKTGVALTDLLGYINWGIDDAVNSTNLTRYSVPYNWLLQADVALIVTVLTNFNAQPNDGSLLMTEMNTFFDNDASNFSIVNNQTFNQIAQDVLTTNATPALWFYAAGGSSLFVLALMCLINRWPRDRYEWGQTISRLILGLSIITFSAIDVHASSDVLTPEFTYEGSRIWYLATHARVLPPYALALFLEQMVELALLYVAGRSYKMDSFTVFFRRVTRIRPYVRANASRHDDELSMGQVPVFDPYEPYDSASYTKSPPHSAGMVPVDDTAARRIASRYRQGSTDSAAIPLVSRV